MPKRSEDVLIKGQTAQSHYKVTTVLSSNCNTRDITDENWQSRSTDL